ncbi:MAG: BatA domain-containing protein [Sorangiineae bacterium]|nr:BatA domain-containing protein [Sorangiineae bacterium]
MIGGLPIGFAQPLVLLGLLSLPVLWWLLRLIPPRPRRIAFPPARLLFDIAPKEETPARTPWWLTALRLGLTALAARPCSSLTPFERRACSLAEAALGAPPVLAVEAPLAGLDEPAEQAMLAVLERARARHRLIVSVETAPATGAAKNLLDALGEVIVLQAGRVVAEGSAETALGRAPRYLVRVTRHAAAFAAALAERGFAPTRASPDGARLVVEVGAAGDPSALVEVALELGAPIVELAPLAPA